MRVPGKIRSGSRDYILTGIQVGSRWQPGLQEDTCKLLKCGILKRTFFTSKSSCLPLSASPLLVNQSSTLAVTRSVNVQY